MRRHTPVSTIMTKDVIALTLSDDLERAEKVFNQYGFRHIPIVRRDVVIGMLSYSDLLKISMANTTEDETHVDAIVYNAFTIEQVMTKDVETITSNTTIKETAEILANRGFHALPVEERGSLVGIVTTTDLLKYFLKQF